MPYNYNPYWSFDHWFSLLTIHTFIFIPLPLINHTSYLFNTFHCHTIITLIGHLITDFLFWPSIHSSSFLSLSLIILPIYLTHFIATPLWFLLALRSLFLYFFHQCRLICHLFFKFNIQLADKMWFDVKWTDTEKLDSKFEQFLNIHFKNLWFGLFWFVEFYGISTFVGYLMPNPLLCK